MYVKAIGDVVSHIRESSATALMHSDNMICCHWCNDFFYDRTMLFALLRLMAFKDWRLEISRVKYVDLFFFV